MESGLYPEAIKELGDVKTKYPYSKFATLAELRIADTYYKRATYIEAIDSYKSFLKLHPNHPDSPYAMFRIGEAYSEQAPSDWFILPPAAEKDQADTRLAITAYRELIARYPDDEMTKQARERLALQRRKLADHELYVASFYFKRDYFQAAAARAEGLLHDYAGVGTDVPALLIAARSYAALGHFDLVRTTLERLIREFPGDDEAKKARIEIESLGVGKPTASQPAEAGRQG